jgi:hypothetical protein
MKAPVRGELSRNLSLTRMKSAQPSWCKTRTVFTFIGYVLSEEGQEILRKEGLITKDYE